MANEPKVTVSARVSRRTRQLALTAARLRKATLSRFAAEAIQEAAERELLRDSEAAPDAGGPEAAKGSRRDN